MPWEQRGARRYYYLPARVDGKPRRIYLGTGDEGRVHELLTNYARRQRAKWLQAVKDRKTAITEAGKGVKELVDWSRQIVRAARLLAGEYTHKGQWRLRGQPRTSPPDAAAEADWKAEVGENDTDNPYQRLVRLNDRANSRDRAAINELTGLLLAESSMWVESDERVQAAVTRWARLLAGEDGGAVAEAVKHTVEWSMALAGATPSPAVRAAAGAAGIAFLAVRFGEAEVSATPAGRRRAVLRRMAVAVNRLQQAVDLVVTAKTMATSAPVVPPRPRVSAARRAPAERAAAA